MFSPKSALAIEFYLWTAESENNPLLGGRSKPTGNVHSWMPTFRDLVGYSCLPLKPEIHSLAMSRFVIRSVLKLMLALQ